MSADGPAVTRGVAEPQAFAVVLAGGDRRTLRNVDAVVREAIDNPRRIAELVGCIIGCDDEIVRMRAGDALEKVCRQRPALVQPHLVKLLGPMALLDQPSVQWHVAQMLAELSLTKAQRKRAAEILCRYLDSSSDWIVLNCSLDSLAKLSRTDALLVPLLIRHLRRYEHSPYRSLTSRAKRLLAEFDVGPEMNPSGKR